MDFEGTDMNEPDDLQLQNGPAITAVPPSARLLLRIVYIMGIILVLLFLLLVGGIIWKSARKAEPQAVAPPATLSLGLPQASEIRTAEIDGDRLVVNTSART